MEKSHVIVSIDEEKSQYKFQHALMIFKNSYARKKRKFLT